MADRPAGPNVPTAEPPPAASFDPATRLGAEQAIGSSGDRDRYRGEVQGTSAWYNEPLSVLVVYHLESGVMVIPPASESGACQIVRLHAPRATMTVDFTAERWQLFPKVPHPDLNDPGIVFVGGTAECQTPLEGPGGRRACRLSGTYEYVFVEPPWTLVNWGPFPTSTAHETTATAEMNTVPAENYVRDLLAGMAAL